MTLQFETSNHAVSCSIDILCTRLLRSGIINRWCSQSFSFWSGACFTENGCKPNLLTFHPHLLYLLQLRELLFHSVFFVRLYIFHRRLFGCFLLSFFLEKLSLFYPLLLHCNLHGFLRRFLLQLCFLHRLLRCFSCRLHVKQHPFQVSNLRFALHLDL